MRTMKYTITVFTIVIFSSPVFAQNNDWGLFVEPGVTYQVSESDVANSTADNNGFGVMGRLGFHFYESFFAAIDGRYIWNVYEDSQNNIDVDANSYNLAPVIGMQMPNFGLRVWGAYVLWGDLDPDSANGLDIKYSEAQGYRIGAGIRAWSASVNLEYEALDYGTTNVEANPFGGAASGWDLDSESWILSVSFPFEI